MSNYSVENGIWIPILLGIGSRELNRFHFIGCLGLGLVVLQGALQQCKFIVPIDESTYEPQSNDGLGLGEHFSVEDRIGACMNSCL